MAALKYSTTTGFRRLKSGKMVRSFPGGGLPELAASLAPAYTTLVALTDAAFEKSAAVKADPNLSPTGRKAALQAWFRDEAAPQLKRSRDAKAKAIGELAALRASMITAAIDKTDVAGALLRQDIRGWFRGMEPAQRAGILAVEPDPLIAAAILEAPAELSGVTSNQRAALEADATARAHPDKLRDATVIEEAIEATATAHDAAAATLQEAIGLSRAELDEALVGSSQIDRIQARLDAAGVGENSA